jgi:hypothetical protein
MVAMMKDDMLVTEMIDEEAKVVKDAMIATIVKDVTRL